MTTPLQYTPAHFEMLRHIREWAEAHLMIDGELVTASVRIEEVDPADNRVYVKNRVGMTLCLRPEQIEIPTELARELH